MRRPSTRLANRRPPLPARPTTADPPGAASPPADVALPAVDGQRQHVLVADARHAVIAEVSYHLARVGFQVTTALTGAEAVTSMRLRAPHLVVPGPTLAGVSAAEIVRRLRAVPDGGDVGALMLLAAGADAVARGDALAAGADDCMPWPGDARELVLRAVAVVRRYTRVRPLAGDAFRCGPLTIDVGRAEVRVDGAAVHFTRTEFDLLWVLVRHAGHLLSREQLTALTWGGGERTGGGGRRVDRHVHFIREKLGPLGAWVATVSRRGYRFAPPAAFERARSA